MPHARRGGTFHKATHSGASIPNSRKPISELGKRLHSLRKEIEKSGIPLLTDEEVVKERIERRGGFYAQ